MKTLQWAAAALAVGALALPARAETVTTNDWWDVKFESPTPSVSVNNIAYGGTTFTEGKLGALTNNASTAGYDAQVQQNQPWASGYWAMVDGDESYWTNECYVAEGDMPTFTNSYLKLDTQGNDLTWTPTNSAIELTTLVDADLYLVGSDSPPDTDDFDSAKDVQTAIYLKNEIDEGSGETTNSVLCVYVEDALSGNPYWQELKGVKLDDNSWAHIQVLVDHTGDPKVSVFVNGTQMSARDGSDIAWTIAHSTSDGAKEHKIHSVAFRGTGAVDNFAGKTLQTSYEEAFFKAEVFMNNQIVAEGETGNSTRVAKAEIGTDKTVTFEDFWFHDYDQDNGHPMTFNLVKIDIVDFSTGTTNTINYIVDSNRQITPGSGSGVTFLTTELDFEGTSYVIQTGEFKISIPTQGAVDTTNTIARIYFEDLPEVGTYNAIATTTVGETTTSDAKKVRPSEFAEGATKTITWEFPAVKDGNLLTTVQVSNGATLEYANKTATVTVTLDAALAADTLFAAATYGTGSLAEGQDLKWTVENGLYTFTSYTPPVAIIVADSGATTNEYETLAAAVAAVQDGETVVLVSTIANESVHYTGTAAFTIDLNGQTWNYLDGENGNYAAFKNDGATVTFKDSSEAGTGKIYCNGDGFCIWSRTGSVVIESGSFVNKSHEDYAIYIGTDDANFVDGVPPTITITGGSFVNEDNAPYNNKPDWSRLVLNVMNSNATTRTLVKTELIQVSGGSYSWDPALGDDNMGGSFVAEGYKSVYDDTTGLYNVVLDAEKFTITFVNGETTLYTTTAYEGFAPVYQGETPAKEATAQFTYAFAGWTNAVAGGPLYAGELPAAAGDTTYTAAFTETVNRYDVTFTVDGTTVATTNAPYGDTLYGPADPVKTAETGYEVAFAGWTNAVAGGATVTAANLPEVTGDATWAAVFTTTAIEYTVTVALDGGTLASGDSIPATYTVETAAFTLPTPTKEGFTFKGWVDGDNQPVTQIAGGTTGNISLTATWEEDSVEVHVNPGDGLDTIENAPAPIEFTAAGLCKIAFKAPAAGKYVLMTSTTVNGTYQAEGTPVEFAEGALVELTETTAGTTKFFKIGWIAPSGN